MTQPVPWRTACERALRGFSDADSIRVWGIGHEVDGTYVPIFNYRFEHTYAAVLLARWLAPATGADAEVVECAAWLHDVVKRLKDPGAKDTHAQDASAEVEGILAGTDFPSAKIPAVRHAIEHHVGLRLTKRLEPLETACLWDCDKLSKVGAASLIHFGCISGAFQPITTAEILRRGEAWLDLARGIVASFNTPPAQVEGRKRLAFLEAHYAQLRREWSDPMETTPE
ncbi:HD domain-containing protein [Geothrix sp. 21YS21S-4]|uniref:HD domain-containing protein n=1 Tax=Geothrix sp. 21YS21S-4 TaxID=3068889 RepID=UPI0027BABD5F|nr:HD domain-containing protein [Geothrix sp. 21YS21S-4]